MAFRLRSPFVRTERAPEKKGVYSWQTNVHDWGVPDTAGKADYSKPFRNHPHVFRAITSISNAAGSVDFQIARRVSGGKIELVESGIEHRTLVVRPSADLSGDMLMSQVAGWLQMACGEAFIRVIREGAARRLVVLNPGAMELKLVSGELRYWYTVERGQRVEVPSDEIIHIKSAFNPYDALRGVGPLQAAAIAYQDDLDTRKYNRDAVRSGGMFAGWIKVPEGGWPSAEEQEKFREMMLKLQRMQQKVALTNGDWQQAGQTPEEMAFIELRRLSFKEIGGVFGVPPQMLGDYERDQADAFVQMLSFHLDTMRPLLRLIADVLTLNLWKITGTSRFAVDTDLFCYFDDSRVPAVARMTQELAQGDREDVRLGITTINRVLERRGEDPMKWGDVWWTSGIMVPITGPEIPAGLFGPTQEPPDDEDDDGEAALIVPSTRDTLEDTLNRHQFRLSAARYEGAVIEALEDIWAKVERQVIARVRSGKALELAGANGHRFAEFLRATDESVRDPFEIEKIAGEIATRLTPTLRAAQASGGNRGLRLARVQSARFHVDAKPAIAQLSRQVQRFAVPVAETTWEKLKDSLSEGLAAGEPEGKLVSRVQEVMGVRRAQAANTAVTEVNAALNGGTQLGYTQSGVVVEKRWLKGSNPRPDHAAAHGQVVKTEADFIVGGERASYPGDPRLSAKQACQCNCTTVPARIKG